MVVYVGLGVGATHAQETADPAPSVPVKVVAQEQALWSSSPVTLKDDLATYATSFFTTGSDYRFPVNAIAVQDVPADAPERTVKFSNEELVLTCPGVEAHAGYELELSFLSDSSDRVESIKAGETVLEKGFALPRAHLLRRRWPIPEAACASGTLVITISKVSGANTVVSAFTLRAHDPAARQIQKPQGSIGLPRLSPRPAAVSGVDNPRFDLGGAWEFAVADVPASGTINTFPAAGAWSSIQVPGQWLQQGFVVGKGRAGVYRRTFTAPNGWAGQRIKLLCDAVYSDATVWVNDHNVGRHLGGFTPFEIDVTDLVPPGREATLVLVVQSDGEADKIAKGSLYANHDLGGIPRKIQLMAVPPVNLASLHFGTTFDADFKDATLDMTARVTNDGPAASAAGRLDLALLDPQGKPVSIQPAGLDIPVLQGGESRTLKMALPVPRAQPWDPEHPRLYTITTKIAQSGTAETVATRLGFRQVEVRGNRLFVNGHVVKLKGVCRHETDPLRGRSLTGNLWRKDAELFAHANINFVRTSHYPPAEEFLDACDEVGIFVESEAPACWVWDASPPLGILLNETMEMVEFNRNHPSVILWSLANESYWYSGFDISANMIQALDPSRPRLFNGGDHDLEVTAAHYPTSAQIAAGDASPIPVLDDEYCHLNAYNREEPLADPGLRDLWGQNFANAWETMCTHVGSLGGSIWAGIDDTFFLPDHQTVGYGTWGVIDGWRRPKPEYWHVTKAYSPVRIVESKAAPFRPGEPIRLSVENRSDFADLSEMDFRWKIGEKRGTAPVQGTPGQTATLVLPASGDSAAGQPLEVEVIGSRGFMVDIEDFVLGPGTPATPPPLRAPGVLALTQDAREIRVAGAGFTYIVDATTGQFSHAEISGRELPISGPCLTVAPHHRETGGQLTGKEPSETLLWGLGTGWKASSVVTTQSSEGVLIKTTGSYDNADGSYGLLISGTGRVTVTWNFKMKDEIDPRQTGVTFVLPGSCDTLSWQRQGQWSTYPKDHIGRLSGTAKAFPDHPSSGFAGPHQPPTWPWSEDHNQYGSNDFRSTKFDILQAALVDGQGAGLRAVAAADRHVHTWIDGAHAMFTIADYANEGSDSFVQFTRTIPDRKIPAGGTVAGWAQVEMIGPK